MSDAVFDNYYQECMISELRKMNDHFQNINTDLRNISDSLIKLTDKKNEVTADDVECAYPYPKMNEEIFQKWLKEARQFWKGRKLEMEGISFEIE